jgi:hypothetical protein
MLFFGGCGNLCFLVKTKVPENYFNHPHFALAKVCRKMDFLGERDGVGIVRAFREWAGGQQ